MCGAGVKRQDPSCSTTACNDNDRWLELHASYSRLGSCRSAGPLTSNNIPNTIWGGGWGGGTQYNYDMQYAAHALQCQFQMLSGMNSENIDIK